MLSKAADPVSGPYAGGDRSRNVTSLAAGLTPRFPITPEQARTVRQWGATERMVRPAAVGPDVFVYVDEGDATLRLQVDPAGYVVNHERLAREPGGG
jgi:hypothetical protein